MMQTASEIIRDEMRQQLRCFTATDGKTARILVMAGESSG